MSSDNRPWYPWYPKEFLADEKVAMLSPMAELAYRRLLDIMWQANDCHLLNDCLKLAKAIARGLSQNEAEKAVLELFEPGCELFKTTPDGKKIYSKRLLREMECFENIRKKRTKAGRKGGQASVKQRLSKRQANVEQTSSQSQSQSQSQYLKESPADAGPFCAFSDEEISESPPKSISDHLQKICDELATKNLFSKSHAFATFHLKKQKNGRAVLQALCRVYRKAISDGFATDAQAWAYGNKIVNGENGNFNEADAIRESEEFKQVEIGSEQVSKLLSGIGGKIE